MSTEMPAYVETVYQFLDSDGWEAESYQVYDGLVVIITTQQTTDSDRSVVVLVLTESASQLTPNHLAMLREVINQRAADGIVVTGDTDLREAVNQTAAEYDRLQELDPMTVYNSLDIDPPVANSDTLTRRRLLAAGGVLAGGGLLSVGYYLPTDSTEAEPVETEPQSIRYDELQANTDQYVGYSVQFSSARIAQVVDSEAGTQLLRIQVTQTDGGWKDNVLGRWDGEPYDENVFVAFSGRVVGTISYQTSLGTDRTIPDIVIESSTEI